MTDQKINVAIAEACGMRLGVLWCEMCQRFCGPEEVTSYGMHDTYEGGCGMRVGSRSVPDYCNDLNAMHEVEMNYQWIDVCSRLDYVQTIEKTMGFKYGATLFATARQRAEAFLRTIGKWVD